MEIAVLRHLHRCLLAFTSVLLLCEITVGHLCKSLINMVDSFHTLFVLIRIILHPSTIPAGVCGTSIMEPHLSPDTEQSAPKNPKASANTIFSSNEEFQYTKLRTQPFGALISSLLLASMCVSFTFEILSHFVHPHLIERPLLATVVGAVSLLFNSLMLVWRGCGKIDVGAPNKGPSLGESNDKATLEGSHSGTLIFCNSVASSVLDPDQASSSHSCPNAPPAAPHCVDAGQSDSHDTTEQTRQTSDYTDPVAEKAKCTNHTDNQHPLRARSLMVMSLLGPVLVLINGLILLFKPDCSNHQWTCNLILYLDPCFSIITVVALLVSAMPELFHYGLLLLQAIPEHLRVEELMAHVSCVPGVLAVHELHVWQLSDECLVASVHVHCSSELGELECSHLLVTVTEVLRGFGVSHCTVQPEFLTICSSGTGPVGLQVGTAMLNEPTATEQPKCSLPCEKECARNMCCLSPEEPSSMHIPLTEQNIVMENVHSKK